MYTKLLMLLPAIGTLLAIMLKTGGVIGGTGSIIEMIGNWRNWPKWIAVGQKLEAIGVDIPKLINGIEKRIGSLPGAMLMLVLLVLALCFSCSSTLTQSQIVSREKQFCVDLSYIRVQEKAFNLLPKAGTLRYLVEAKEDSLCADIATVPVDESNPVVDSGTIDASSAGAKN